MDKGKIIVLDDDPAVTLSCKRILGAEGFNITTVSRGEDAVRQLEKEEYELLITDIRLPDVSGIEVVKEARVIQPNTDVVVITGYPTLEDAKESIRLGAFEYIEKPFTPEFMINVARKIFDRRGWILRQAYINEFRNYIVPLRDRENPVVFYKEGVWARPTKSGLWEIGYDLRYEMASGEMLYVDYLKVEKVKAGEPFARLLTGSGKIIDIPAPMTSDIREFNTKANDVIGSLLKEHLSEGWLVWLARVVPLEL
ncbi:cell cycle response regulator CtrA [bacterium BMS3Bbin06]|nr:cell cycle response regulator CtrA [bacterium BMS3Abin08]GBE35702.1 cell cycle response regulator CtrA [bacterium BMS3Bbin06]HDO36958.1 response regulator [Nitrospirota bacterium]HDY72037.1 response regulator [Nitrospirota bacterium]